MKVKTGDLLRHYKGTTYVVIFLSKHTETLEQLVTYENADEFGGQFWTRPLSMFDDVVSYKGASVQRFVKL